MGTADDVTARCAVHPSLPATDECPVCARPRCSADAAAAPGGGCLACEGRRARTGAPPLDLAALVAAGAASNVVAVPAGMIASEYVGAGWFVGVLAVPAFVGIALSMTAEWAAGKKRGRALRLLAAFYSVLAVAIGFQSPRAAETPFAVDAVPSYVVAALVSWLWTAPPRVVPRREET